jgi:hypothetical protein
MNKQLAKIKSAGLEIKERGILNFWIIVDYEDGGSQGIGGIALDTYDEEKKTQSRHGLWLRGDKTTVACSRRE